MFLRNLIYFFVEAAKGFAKSRWMGFVSIGTLTIALMIVGIFFIVTLNLISVMGFWRQEVDVVAFLKEGLTDTQIEDLRRRIEGRPEVEEVEYTSKEQALAEFKRWSQHQEVWLDAMEGNPLPASFDVKVGPQYDDKDNMKKFVSWLYVQPEIEDVEYGGELIEKISLIIRTVSYVNLILGILLGLGSLFIISNTIKLTVYARRREIEIMKLVGATSGFIGGPFIVEGLMQGLISGTLAVLALFGLYNIFVAGLGSLIDVVTDIRFLSFEMCGGLVAAGVLLGGWGSLIAVRRFVYQEGTPDEMALDFR
ncbi:MAG: permease-like cell division protein FtsX [bacterium]